MATRGQCPVILRVNVVNVNDLAMWLPMFRLEKHVVLFIEIRTTLLDLVLVKFRSVVPSARESAIPTVGQVHLLWCVVLSTLVHCLVAVTATFVPLCDYVIPGIIVILVGVVGWNLLFLYVVVCLLFPLYSYSCKTRMR